MTFYGLPTPHKLRNKRFPVNSQFKNFAMRMSLANLFSNIAIDG